MREASEGEQLKIGYMLYCIVWMVRGPLNVHAGPLQTHLFRLAPSLFCYYSNKQGLL